MTYTDWKDWIGDEPNIISMYADWTEERAKFIEALELVYPTCDCDFCVASRAVLKELS